MRTLLRKIGFGLLVAVVTVSFAGAFDLAWAKSDSDKPNKPNPPNQFPPISSFTQASNDANPPGKGGRQDGDAPGKGSDNPKGCASPPCRHHGHGHGHGHH